MFARSFVWSSFACGNTLKKKSVMVSILLRKDYSNHVIFRVENYQPALQKLPLFHLISWCWNFVERHIFRIVSGNCAFPQIFHTRKLGEITVFYAMQFYSKYSRMFFCFEIFFILRESNFQDVQKKLCRWYNSEKEKVLNTSNLNLFWKCFFFCFNDDLTRKECKELQLVR